MGKVLITGGGGAGGMSDDMTAANGVTADLVPKGQTYIGADTDDEIGTGTMELEATANAQTAHVLNGEKFFTKNEQLPDKPLTGTMPNIGALDTTTKARISGNYLVLGMTNGAHIQNGGSGTTGVPEVQMSFDEISKNASLKGQINAGIIKKNSKILGVTGTYTGDGNANRGDVLVGKTFSSANGLGLSGTIPNNGYYKYAGGFGSGKENNVDYYSFNNIPVGYYGEASSNASWAPEIRMKATDFRNYIGLTSEKIAFGQVVAGMTGTYYSGDIAKNNSPFVNKKFAPNKSINNFVMTESFVPNGTVNIKGTSGSTNRWVVDDHIHLEGKNFQYVDHDGFKSKFCVNYNEFLNFNTMSKITIQFMLVKNNYDDSDPSTGTVSIDADGYNNRKVEFYIGNSLGSNNLQRITPTNKDSYVETSFKKGVLYTTVLDVSKITVGGYFGIQFGGYYWEGGYPEHQTKWEYGPWMDIYSISFS